MRSIRPFLVLALPLVPALAIACGGGKPAPANPGPASSASSSAVVEAPKPVEVPAKKIADVTLGTTKAVLEECTFEEELHSKDDPLKSIARLGDRLFLSDGTDLVRAYSIKPGCKLALDTTFGDKGAMKLAGRADYVAADGKGNLFASTGVFDTYLIRDGKASSCGHHYTTVHPSGAWGLTTFANSTVEKLTIADGKCSVAPWALANINDDKKRTGPLESVTAVTFAHDLAWVGGRLAKTNHYVVLGLDADGNEKVRFGGEKVGAPDTFGWVHAVAPCAPGICVADANFRAVSAWTKDGTLVGQVKLHDHFKDALPWNPSLTEQDGKLLVGISLRSTSGGENVAKVVRLSFNP